MLTISEIREICGLFRRNTMAKREHNLSDTLYQSALDTVNWFVNFLAEKRGLPLLLGLLLVVLNFFCQFIPALGWFAEYDVLLHLGVILSIIGSLMSSIL
jgi:hypothetical protein